MTVWTLASSSSGNCTIVSHGDTHLLIDAGISLRRMREGLRYLGLSPDDLTGVLVTHEHSDHIGGIEMLLKYYKTPVYASCGSGFGICRVVPEAGPFINCFEAGISYELGEITVSSFRTPHDAIESLGYRLTAGGRSLIYATDLGCITDEVVEATRGADIAVIEANHDRDMLKSGPYPPFLKRRILSARGHLSNADSGRLAEELAMSGVRTIQLAHLSCENNTPGLARKTVTDAICRCGLEVGRDVELDVAPQFEPGKVYVL